MFLDQPWQFVRVMREIEFCRVDYIVGSCDNERVIKLQKMLLLRLMQIVKGQDRSKVTRPVCVVLDEFKHVISPVALTTLGVVRDFNSHFLLAHQSLVDLRQCPGIDPAAVEGAVLDNTALKIIFRINDGEHAERLAKAAGRKRTYIDTSSKVDLENPGNWRETHIPHLNPDLLTHLPVPSDRKNQPATGVLIGAGLAKVFYVDHIAATEPMPAVQPAQPFSAAPVAEASEKLI